MNWYVIKPQDGTIGADLMLRATSLQQARDVFAATVGLLAVTGNIYWVDGIETMMFQLGSGKLFSVCKDNY